MKKFNIAITINYLAIGGTQSFAFSLAQGLSNLGHNVIVYDFNFPFFTRSIRDLNSPLLDSKSFDFKQFKIPIPDFIYFFLIRVNFLQKVLNTILNYLRIFRFKKVLKQNNVDIVSSHLMAADTISSFSVQNMINIKHCITMHGSYEGFSQLALKKKRIKVFNRVNGIIYLTKKNIEFLSKLQFNNQGLKIRQIYNGYLPAIFEKQHVDTPSTLKSIPSNAFVFVQVARGAKDKGWEELVQAFLIALSKTKSKLNLILVGDGEYLEEIKKRFNHIPEIIFYGYSGNPIPIIKRANVGILASYYPGESLPNTIIEYITAGKPVISSNIGEINAMIGINSDNPCGFTLELTDSGPIDINLLAVKMLEYVEKTTLYVEHSKNAILQSRKFNMETCACAYQQFFCEL